MFQQVTGEREREIEERERERRREKTPFGAEMERIDSVAPSGKRHF